MKKQTKGTIIVLSGSSGVGKSTIIKEIRKKLPNLEFSISCTTRQPRVGELNHREYHFLSQEDFEKKVLDNEFIEYAGVFSNRYGTLKNEVIERINLGKNVILDIDVQGAMQIKERAKDIPFLAKHTVFVFIAPPSKEQLEDRLRKRNSDSEEQINLRLAEVEKELSCWQNYDYLIINDKLEEASNQLINLIKSLDLRTANFPEEMF